MFAGLLLGVFGAPLLLLAAWIPVELFVEQRPLLGFCLAAPAALFCAHRVLRRWPKLHRGAVWGVGAMLLLGLVVAPILFLLLGRGLAASIAR